MPKASRTGGFRKAAARDASQRKQQEKTAKLEQHAASKSAQDNGDDHDTSTAAASTATVEATDLSQLSRGQRKRLAKQKQYQRKQELIMSSLQLKRQEEQAKRIDGLDAIKNALLATVQVNAKKTKEEETKTEAQTPDEHQKPNLLKSNKSRQLLVQKEKAQISLVMQHPSFQADPLATIRQHLQNTLAQDAASNQEQHAQHVADRQVKQDEKKAHKKQQVTKKRKHRVRPTRSRK